MQFRFFFEKNLYEPNERARRVGHENRTPSLPRSTYDFYKIPKVRKSTIIMPADYGHVSKNFDPVFVGADSPDSCSRAQ